MATGDDSPEATALSEMEGGGPLGVGVGVGVGLPVPTVVSPQETSNSATANIRIRGSMMVGCTRSSSRFVKILSRMGSFGGSKCNRFSGGGCYYSIA